MGHKEVGSGVPPLDEVIHHLWLGDNVVWKMDNLEDYLEYARAFVDQAIRDGRKVVYFRFAAHVPVLEENPVVDLHVLDPSLGFQHFSFEIYKVIRDAGVGVFYVFDALSALQQTWATDLMVGNFFSVVCPYLFKLDTVAYFCLLRKEHDWNTVSRITETTQVFIDVSRVAEGQVVQPKKVWRRHSKTMFQPHIWVEGTLVAQSNGLSHLLRLPDPISHKMDYWDRLFMDAERALDNDPYGESAFVEKLAQVLLGSDHRILSLAMEHLTLEDLLGIRNRMIGTGYIGGKSVGMLLARKIVKANRQENVGALDIQNDSLYIGSDVWQTFLIHNRLWLMHMEQRSEEGYFALATTLQEKIQEGEFPRVILDEFAQALDALGTMPIIVRSSSLLEDSYGNAFAGKYESVFCTNQGTSEERMEAFTQAVKTVYASTVSHQALTYRKQRGLDHLAEEMSVLVQCVSGSLHGNYLFPLAAGVALSYSSYVWHKEMRPEGGMVRLVMGLGTRAVDRTETDHTRILSLDLPDVLPGVAYGQVQTQSWMDVLDLEENELLTIPVEEGMASMHPEERDLLAGRQYGMEAKARELGLAPKEIRNVDFAGLLKRTGFVKEMAADLQLLENTYGSPVDVEFTVNMGKHGLEVDLVQCRPLQTADMAGVAQLPDVLRPEKTFFEMDGGFVGSYETRLVDMLVFVRPEAYVALGERQRHEVARTIGKVNAGMAPGTGAMLIVPGRCGTTMASLGVPVRFAEISKFNSICEVAYPEGGMTPELSFGSHFFQDLIESNIFYASFHNRSRQVLRQEWLDEGANRLSEYVEDSSLGDVLQVVRMDKPLKLVSDMRNQRAVCYLD
ncbi:PEP/pyruvate-binding domain-containing protein [Anaerotalea alkaliphila]|uniref:Pyruvate kinase n=1 Tax=Anaerotalea alkaliphila TaxID=2662126 RepID=A0A7X5HXW8_9FIRM|nr:PEP/pyruvate-binding domain-containing protein [Anaerotalea alkaliphila]NDL68683.1 pyruvate kinase [Anaerotalea alkaliphila]